MQDLVMHSFAKSSKSFFETLNEVQYRPDDELLSSGDIPAIYSFLYEHPFAFYSLLGQAYAMARFEDGQLRNCLEIQDTTILYSVDLQLRFFDCLVSASVGQDNKALMDHQQMMNPGVQFHNPQTRISSNSQDLIFLGVNYLKRILGHEALDAQLSLYASILRTGGRLVCPLSDIGNDFISGSFEHLIVNKNSNYGKNRAIRVDKFLGMNLSEGSYNVGSSFWDKDSGQLIDAVSQSISTISLHSICEIAKRAGFTANVLGIQHGNAKKLMLPDDIELTSVTGNGDNQGLLVELVKH